MIQLRAPKRSIRHTRMNMGFDKAKKRIIEGMKREQMLDAKQGLDYRSDEDNTWNQKSALTCHTSSSVRRSKTCNPKENEPKAEYLPQSNICPLIHVSNKLPTTTSLNVQGTLSIRPYLINYPPPHLLVNPPTLNNHPQIFLGIPDC